MSDVVVYSGPGVSVSALHHTFKLLQTLLPTYDVKSVDAKTLTLDPWQSSTALVVIPGGRDLPFVCELSKEFTDATGASYTGYQQIRDYVDRLGGCFMGICAGAYYASGHCSFELGTAIQVDGDRPFLRFFPGTCQGTVYPGFVYESDKGARIIDLRLTKGNQMIKCYYNGGGAFIDADQYINQGVEVLARYLPCTEPKLPNQTDYGHQAAAVLCRVGKGTALLFGTHPEFSLVPRTGASPKQGHDDDEKDRLQWLHDLFSNKLGLRAELPDSISKNNHDDPKLLPIVMTSFQDSIQPVIDSIKSLIAERKTAEPVVHLSSEPLQSDTLIGSLKDSNDPIHICLGHPETTQKLFAMCKAADYDEFSKPVELISSPAQPQPTKEQPATTEKEVDLNSVPKYLVVYPSPHQSLPDPSLLPYWDISAYRRQLDEFRSQVAVAEKTVKGHWASWESLQSGMWSRFGFGSQQQAAQEKLLLPANIQRVRIGSPMLYTQMVTSTQTMLDRNFRLLSAMPVGTTFFATQQMSGRGRGGNRWISPRGCLQFSSVFRVPLSMASKTVFLQYLSGLAIVEGIRLALGEHGKEVGEKVRIKWPNDVYAEVDDPSRTATFQHNGRRYAKLAGVLVNSQFSGDDFVLIAGCGINCLNDRPTTSVSDLIKTHNQKQLKSQANDKLVPEISQETLAAAILTTLESMWKTFLGSRGDFSPFIQSYRNIWLHNDQQTILTQDAVRRDTMTEAAASDQKVRIVGISSDHGLLQAVDVSSRITSQDVQAWGQDGIDMIQLQPDGNSFDMLKNMVKRKV